MDKPLALKLAPKSLNEVIGQSHLIGKDKIISNMVKNKKIFSMILYGKPGIGKTSIANAIVKGLTGKDVGYKLGWNKDNIGWWYCTDVENKYYYTSKDGWKQIDGEWYIFDSRGYAYHNSWYKSGS